MEESVEESFADWISSPQMLVGLSAILLSVCGLFVSIYEASLMRQQQRASVWPHVQVGYSQGAGEVTFAVRNTGVGPAHIRAAHVPHEDTVAADWSALLQSVSTADTISADTIGYSVSLISGSVLPPQSEREDIFSMEDGAGPTPLLWRLKEEVRENNLDVTVCYCSVYDQCWRTTLQNSLRVLRGEDPSRHRSVDDCEGVAQSGI